jgi:hypothetical protein
MIRNELNVRQTLPHAYSIARTGDLCDTQKDHEIVGPQPQCGIADRPDRVVGATGIEPVTPTVSR